MAKAGRVFVRLALLVGVGLALTVFVGGKAVAADKLKVGIVNLRKAVDEFQMKKDREQELKEMKAAKEQDIQKRLKEVESLVEEMKVLDENNPQRKVKRWILAEKRALLEAARQVATNEFQEKYRDAIEEVYNKILANIEEFRKLNGYDLIIRVDVGPLRSASLELMSEQLNRKIVLAYSEAFDCTEDLVAFMNSKYAKKAK